MTLVRLIVGLVGVGASAALLAQAAIPPDPGRGNGGATRAEPSSVPSSAVAPGATSAMVAQGATAGRALFHEKCGMCHTAGGMGTGLLARRMDPAVAELEKRVDLTPDYVTTAARTGIGNMPAIARGEVSDRQMAAIAAYLSKAKAP